MKLRRKTRANKEEKDKSIPKVRIRWSRKKKAIVAIAVVVILTASGVVGRVVVWPMLSTAEETTEAASMEGYVSKGNIDITTSVSGTTANGTVYQLYDLNLEGDSEAGSLEISKVNAASGDTVKKGDTLLTLTQSSVDETKLILESAVESYTTALTQAKVDYEEAVAQAKADYQTNLSLVSTASLDYQDALAAYADTVKSTKKQLTTAQDIINTYPAQIEKYQDKITSLKTQIASLKKEVAEKTKTMNTAKTAYEAAQKAYETAQTEYSDIEIVSKYLTNYSTDSSLSAIKKDVTTQLAAKKTKQTEAKNTYETAKKTYEAAQTAVTTATDKKTKAKTSKDNYSEKLTNAKTNLSEAKKNLESYKSAYYTAVSEQTVGKVSAQQTYAESMSTYNNAKSIYESALQTAKDELQTAKDNASSAKSRLKAFQNTVVGNVIKASQDGTIVSLDYVEGNSLSNMMPIATYSDSSSIGIPITVDQADIQYLSVGSQVNVSVSSSREQLTGTVAAIETASSSESVSTVTYTVTVTVDNASGTISSDETAAVSFTKYSLGDVLYVPVSAVTEKNGKNYVTAKLTDGNTRDVEVTTGEDNGQFIELKSGLEEGDTYVVNFKK